MQSLRRYFMNIKKVGVVGCGTMGAGIVQLCAQSGYTVTVSEVNELILNKGLKFISTNLNKSVEKNKLTPEEKELIFGRIKGTTSLADFKNCDLVIEAATENIDHKKKLFNELDKVCPKDSIFATNTSCLSITDMAIATGRPEKVVGLHFFNPALVMGLVEIVRTIMTSDETVTQTQIFGQSLGKTVVLARDTPGFIVNRLMIPFILNAIRMLESGAATKDDIDTAIKLGLNHPMGPLTLADLIGLDVVSFVANAIYEDLKDSQYICPMLLKKMVVSGWLGRKTGKGFYNYK
jgi:3-hydroxybutyryl-CoA dehydrogenase